MSLFTSLLTAGTNSHQETSENANGIATDFVSQGVIGSISNTSGVAPATGGFAVNAQGTPDMTVAVSTGVAYVTATPTSQSSQSLRVKNASSANVTITSNSSGSTKYDWLYVSIDASKAANPADDASDVASLTTSRSSSSSTDNGTPPTYGYCIAVITVSNGASSITNANITDKRVNPTISLAASQVTTAKIADDAVTPDKWSNSYYFKATSTNSTTLPIATYVAYVYNTALVTNAAYSTTTGKFTAPVAGFYHFDAGAIFSTADVGFIALYINGAMPTDGSAPERIWYNCKGFYLSDNILLAAGDTVQVYLQSLQVANTVNATLKKHVQFSGYLVNQTA
jgi:hypothetical protein